LSRDQAGQLAERAKQASQSSSQWGRQAILDCLQMSAGTRVVLQELMALRKTYLALKLDEIHAQPLTEDRLRLLLEQAEATKAAMAENRIHSMRSNDANH
jgi:hypothetical protein